MATKKTMVVPCMVNMRLKTCGETKSLCGCISWMRMMMASTPATTRKNRRIDDVENSQPLVINRGHPPVKRVNPRLLVNLHAGNRDRIR